MGEKEIKQAMNQDGLVKGFTVNTSDVLLLDVLFQACGLSEDTIDNMGISLYERACDYLTKWGLLVTDNKRIYKLSEKGKKIRGGKNDM